MAKNDLIDKKEYREMKKSLFILAAMFLVSTSAALADGMVFDPTEYPATEEIPVSKTISAPSSSQIQANRHIENNIKESSTISQDAVSNQNGNFNNALFELDSAQVNIRNELLEHQAKYQEVDTQYQLIKEQRKVLASQIKAIKNRIKAIEKSKQNIRKTMI